MKKISNSPVVKYIKVVLAALLYAIAVEVFLMPISVFVGGATGIAAILDKFIASDSIMLSTGIFVVVINIPIIIYCFVAKHRVFATRTTVYVGALAVCLVVLRVFGVGEWIHEALNDGSANKMLFTILGGAISGVSLPLMLSLNGSTGGSDVVGLIVQKYNKTSSSDSIRAMFISNIIIMLVAAIITWLVADLEQALDLFIFSISAIVIGEFVHEALFRGFSSAIELEITTSKPQEMADKLQAELKHGVTYLEVIGGYSKEKRVMILCVIGKRQLTRARRIINQVDNTAFAYVENVREVIGTGFVNKEDKLDV